MTLALNIFAVAWVLFVIVMILYANLPPQRAQRARKKRLARKFWNLQDAIDKYHVPEEVFEVSGRLPNLYVMKDCAIIGIIFMDWDEISHKVTEQGNTNWLNAQFSVLDGIIAEYQGIIPIRAMEFMVAVFYEGTDGEKIENALNAILQIKKAQKRVGQPLELQLAFGLHAGTCVLGAMAESVDVHSEFFTAIGDNVNMSSRLASLAAKTGSGEVLICDAVYISLDKEKFPCKKLATVSVKGKEYPVNIYSLSFEKPGTGY